MRRALPRMSRRTLLESLPLLVLLAVSAAVFTPSPCGSQSLEEKVTQFTLANGMRFIVVERHVAPVFFVAMAFNVGSINEIDGKTGISHLLEHMFFKGTKTIGTVNYAKERKYLAREDELATQIAADRRAIGGWRTAIFDDFTRATAASLPEETKQQIGSDKIQELQAVISALENGGKLPDEASRYPTLVQESGTDYYADYVVTKKLELELARVQQEHKPLIVKDEIWDIYLEQGGRMLNAFTGTDLTAYIIYLPSNRLELWMSVEADRLKNPVLREFYQERDVVTEERRLGENDPDEALWDAFEAAAFQALPYRRPIVGWMSDLQNLLRPDLEAYFMRNYSPSNATVIMVGDLNPKTVETMARRYFERIPGQPPVPPPITQEPEQLGERRIAVEHTANPRLIIGYHIPTAPHPDNYPVQALMAMLGQGRTSRLYRIYEELQLTSSAPEVSNGPGDKLDNLLMIEATPRHPHTAEEVEKAIYDEIEAVKNQPPSDYEMQRIRNKIDANMVRTLGTNVGLAFNLGFSAVIRGDWRTYLTDQEKLKQVPAEDVSYVAKKYLVPENRTVATLVQVEKKEEESPAAGSEEIDMQALIDFVKTLPEAEQREIFQRVQSMSPEEQEAFARQMIERMKAAPPARAGEEKKEADGGK